MVGEAPGDASGSLELRRAALLLDLAREGVPEELKDLRRQLERLQ